MNQIERKSKPTPQDWRAGELKCRRHFFIKKRNGLDQNLEKDWRRPRNLRGQRTYDCEIRQTKFLINVFKNRLPIIEQFIVYPEKQLEIQLKNGLKPEEIDRKVVIESITAAIVRNSICCGALQRIFYFLIESVFLSKNSCFSQQSVKAGICSPDF